MIWYSIHRAKGYDTYHFGGVLRGEMKRYFLKGVRKLTISVRFSSLDSKEQKGDYSEYKFDYGA